MYDYDEPKSFPVSNCPLILVTRFDNIAKRLTGSRTMLIRMLMESCVRGAEQEFMREATTQQFVKFATWNTLKGFGIKPKLPDDPENQEHKKAA